MICKDVENTFLCCSSSFTCKSHKKIVTVTNKKNMNIHKEAKKPSPHATLEWLSHTQSRAFRLLTRTQIKASTGPSPSPSPSLELLHPPPPSSAHSRTIYASFQSHVHSVILLPPVLCLYCEDFGRSRMSTSQAEMRAGSVDLQSIFSM